MGVVYRAEDTRLLRFVALKFLPASDDAAARDRFLREAQAAAALNHPNICTIYEVDEEHGFLAMELVEGPSLKDKIAERPLKLDEALELASQIAAGLQAAHDKGVTHRDIKPANILLTHQGQVKITDFGLAALVDRTRITRTGTSMGTPAYMSPEQAKGERLDRRTDLWSLGVVLYEMLTGRLPFAGDTEQAVSYGIVNIDPEPPTALRSGLPVEIDRVTAKALAKNPGARYQNAADLQVDLKWSATSMQRRAIAPGGPRLSAPWVAAGVAGLAAAALAIVHFTEKPATPDPISIRMTGTLGGAALSPDGLHVVYSGLASGGSRMLILRALASAEARPMEGTEGAYQPFWSPDGKHIGFFAKRKLRRIAAAGGPIEVICDIESGRGASWNQAGDIILQPSSRLPLSIVKASGGKLSPVTKLDTSRQENSHRHPQFLPDGKHFLYLARATPENTGIYVGLLDGGQPKRLLTAQSNAKYAGGHLFFVRDGTLYRQAFDLSALTLAAEPEAIAKEVTHALTGSAAEFDVSANGRTLVYLRGSRNFKQLTWFDRSGTEGKKVGSPNQVIQPRISPDGRQVVFSMPDPHAGNRDLWMMDLTTQASQRITLDPANDWMPTWSGDGSKILFVSDRKEGVHKLYRQAAEGTAAESSYGEPGRPVQPLDWSKDGRYILMQSESGLAILDTASDGKPIPFTHSPYREGDAKISPNGRWIIYTSNKSGQFEIYIRSFEQALLGTSSPIEKQVSSQGGGLPRWRADSRELFYVSPNGTMMSVEFGAGDGMNPKPPRELFKTCSQSFLHDYWQSDYDVTSDGRRFLFACPGESGVMEMNIIRDFAGLLKR